MSDPTKADLDLLNTAIPRAGVVNPTPGATLPSATALLNALAPSPEQFGAVAGTTTDQTAALQRWIDYALLNKCPTLILNKAYYINGILRIRLRVAIDGVAQDGQDVVKQAPIGSFLGTLVLGPNGKIIPEAGSSLRRVNIISEPANVLTPNTDADVEDAMENWAGTAISIEEEVGVAAPNDVRIDECLIVGFHTAIKCTSAQRWTLTRNKIDCLNGILVEDTRDVGRAEDNHLWPFWTAQVLGLTKQADMRPGCGIRAVNQNDGCFFVNNLVYGYKTGIEIDGPLANLVRGNWIDNFKERTDLVFPARSVGIRVTGASRYTSVVDNHVNVCGVSYLFDHAYATDGTEGVIATNNTAASCIYRYMELGTGDGTVNGFLAGGDCGTHAIEFLPAAPDTGYWQLDNIVVQDTTVKPDTVPPTRAQVFSVPQARLPRISFGSVITPRNAVYDYAAMATVVQYDTNGADQSLAAGYTDIAFSTARVDTLGEYNPVARTFTPKVRGLYAIDLSFGFSVPNLNPTYLAVLVLVDGIMQRRWQSSTADTAGLHANCLSMTLRLEAGQTVTFQAYTSAALSMAGAANRLDIYRHTSQR